MRKFLNFSCQCLVLFEHKNEPCYHVSKIVVHKELLWRFLSLTSSLLRSREKNKIIVEGNSSIFSKTFISVCRMYLFEWISDGNIIWWCINPYLICCASWNRQTAPLQDPMDYNTTSWIGLIPTQQGLIFKLEGTTVTQNCCDIMIVEGYS